MTARTTAVRPSGAVRARRLPPGGRKAAVSLHVITSVGWLGVHGSMLALAAAAAADPEARAGALGAAGLLSGLLVLPLSLTAAGTGLLLALGTPWGLFRHTWVAAKLVLTLLLVAGSNLSIGPMVRELAADPAAAGGAGMVRALGALSVSFTVLLATVLLSTVKPFGRLRLALPGRAAPSADRG
ncbi:hypothetical protein [Nocardiopsis suaedae]|uniref:DUF2269 domain-containing protein n=1 Tax=Nocardiopsis suaedae TaxID=3018444 RepID=A0ABT4TGR5_9ACTN|nr:hypothetical protein [Nocardiopsis suaedae]MDA2803776.1 hypothetical protein [Nocardiopsis suaedae]